MIRITLFLFLLMSFASVSTAQKLEWVNSIGDTSGAVGVAVVVDQNDFIYTVGNFTGSPDFDKGPGVSILTSNSGKDDVFIVKNDSHGNLIWAKSVGGDLRDNVYSITVDNFGNLIITGSFRAIADFDPGSGVFNLVTGSGTSVGKDCFILKLDNNGNFIWASRLGSHSEDNSGRSVVTDNLNNIYTIGTFEGTSFDMDPGTGTHLLNGSGTGDIFISKLSPTGNFVWGKQIGGPSVYVEDAIKIDIDSSQNIYIVGLFRGTCDFDPSPTVYNVSPTNSQSDYFLLKLDSAGNFLWVNKFGGTNHDYVESIYCNKGGFIYLAAYTMSQTDADPGLGVSNFSGGGIFKYDLNGEFKWARYSDGTVNFPHPFGIIVDENENIFVQVHAGNGLDMAIGPEVHYSKRDAQDNCFLSFDSLGKFRWFVESGFLQPNIGEGNLNIALDSKGNLFGTGMYGGLEDFGNGSGNFVMISNGVSDFFTLKIRQQNVVGKIFNDISADCIQNAFEQGLEGRNVIINPGNIVTQTDQSGRWYVDSLAPGNYIVTIDTTGFWTTACPLTQNLTIINSDSLVAVPSFGLTSTQPCPKPDVSILMPVMRRCFTDQRIFVTAKNLYTATDILVNSYVDIELDSLIQPTGSSVVYQTIGNIYRFTLDTLRPGQNYSFWMDATVSCDAVNSQTLCMEANITPVEICMLDTIPSSNVGGTLPCVLPYDNSSIVVESWCDNDSIYFTIQNIGSGNMQCYSPSRIYLDGQLYIQDSFLLSIGEIDTLIFTGDGRTWRLEADQHPLHPGTSHPSTTIELCGNQNNWTPGLVNIFPMNDADPVVDIYCGIVTGSYDPNDKTGYPLGITDTHFVAQNQKMEYVIRFQNTGNDTAITVIIRDTLEIDLDIFSVVSGASSHDYHFSMYGPRILQWVFPAIMLPDSTSDEPGSHGFVTFSVNQNPNLFPGTELNNEVGIYFDYNEPVITNTTSHVIKIPQYASQYSGYGMYSESSCDAITFHGVEYDESGSYYQVHNDSLFYLSLTVHQPTETIITTNTCGSYTLNSQTYSSSGTYQQMLASVFGCDSLISLNLTINEDSDSIMNIVSCNHYVLNSQTYVFSGTYSQTLTNANGCDSVITLNLIITENSDSIMNIISCNTFELNSQIYSSSGTFIQNLINSDGCDSLITLNLTINNTDSSVTQNNLTLTAATSGAIYQWLDCNNGYSTILNAINQSFTPIANGSYAVSVTENGCMDTSACFTISTIGVSENSFGENIRIYPNPSNGKLFIDLGMKTEKMNVSVKNAIGQIVYSESYQNKNILELNLNVERGIYFVELMSEEGSKVVYKLVID
jgi:uncharacterized repeat protein (TIGR01451 family)